MGPRNKHEGRRHRWPHLMKHSKCGTAKRTDRPPFPEIDQTKSAVLNGLAAIMSRRSYQQGMQEYIDLYRSEPRLASTLRYKRTSPHADSFTAGCCRPGGSGQSLGFGPGSHLPIDNPGGWLGSGVGWAFRGWEGLLSTAICHNRAYQASWIRQVLDRVLCSGDHTVSAELRCSREILLSYPTHD
jgi:hypothetical protein